MITFREWMNEKEGKGESEYQIFFKKKLEKFGVKSASELTGDDKKKFFDEVDAEWESDDENSGNENCNESAAQDRLKAKVLQELLAEVDAIYRKFDNYQVVLGNTTKIFSQSKLTEVKVKLMDLLEK